MRPVPRKIERNMFQLMKLPKYFFKHPPDKKISQKVLLLGTMGRKTGKLRFTPLQYEYFNTRYYFGAMRGKNADWVKNIQANSTVVLQLGRERTLIGTATISDDPVKIYSFLQLRLARNPKMISIILKLSGVRVLYDREDLLNYAKKLCIVTVTIKKSVKV